MLEFPTLRMINQVNRHMDEAPHQKRMPIFDINPKYFNDVHMLAWELGVKTLYYCRSTSGIKVYYENGECLSCEG